MKYETIHCDIVEIRTQAIQICTGPNTFFWIPLSVIEDAEEIIVKEEDDVDINIAKWFVDKENIE